MTTYGIWFQKEAYEPYRVTYLCGKESVLREEALDRIKKLLNPTSINLRHLSGVDDIWDCLDQFPLDCDSPHLTIIRHAEDIKDWSGLEQWSNTIRRYANIYVVFIDETSPYVVTDMTKALKPHLTLVQKDAKMQIVVCSSLAAVAPKDSRGIPTRAPDIALWLNRFASINEWDAVYLHERVGGDLRKAKDVCLKAGVFPYKVSRQSIDALVEESVGDALVQALFEFDKPRAIAAVREIHPDRYSQIIRSLVLGLEMMARLNRYHRLFKTKRDAMSDDHIPKVVCERYWEASARWDTPRRVAAQTALGAVDATLRAYGQAGALEALVALW